MRTVMRLFLVSTLLLFGVTFSSQAYAESASAVYNGDGTATYAVEGNTGEIILQRMAYLGHLPIVDEHVLGVGETVTLPVDASTRCWEMYYDFGDDVDFIGSGGCVELGIGPITFFELSAAAQVTAPRPTRSHHRPRSMMPGPSPRSTLGTQPRRTVSYRTKPSW